MAQNAPGRHYRENISVMELADMFPDEDSARDWFEKIRWDGERFCGHCGSTDTSVVPRSKPMPYYCRSCKSYFSVRTGTVLQESRLPLRKWVFAIYLEATSLTGVSSMKLHNDIKVTQKTAWFLLHRIRETFAVRAGGDMAGPVEVDETNVGGKRRNKPLAKRKELKGRGPVDMTTVVGAKDRGTNRVTARVVENREEGTLKGFVREHVRPGATVYTDEFPAYKGMSEFDHETVNHSVSEYVRGMVHTNGVESFWAALKRGYHGTYRKMSPKHLNRYVQGFAGKHNFRDSDTIDQMRDMVAGFVGKRLTYVSLTKDNGLDSGARS